MATLRQVFPRSVVVVCLTLLVIEAVVLLSQLGREPGPYRLRLGIAAPVLVAESLAAQADALSGQPFDGQVLVTGNNDAEADAATAQRAVRSGRSFAAVAVDLTAETDTLFVSTVADETLNRLVRARVATMEGGYGRTLRVVQVPPTRNPDVGREVGYLLTGLWIVAGFLCAAVLTLVRGPVARSFELAVARVVGLAAASVVVAGVIAAVASAASAGSPLPLWGLGAATTLAAAWTTLAFEAMARLAGLALATTLFLLLAAPLFALDDPRLLPWPWSPVTPWTLHGSALGVAERIIHFDAAPVLRHLCTLLAWIVLPLLTLALSRRERTRDEAVRAG